MKKYLLILLIIFPSVIFTSCGSIDFTVGSGSNLLSLLGVNFNTGRTAPEAPVNLQSTAIATNKIDLVWENNSSNIMGFRIERSTGSNANLSEIASILRGSATSYSDNAGLTPGTTYYYRIRAFNAAGNSDYSNITNATTYSSTPLVPANPSILQAAASSASQVIITWHDNSDNEVGFNVERRSEDETDFTEIAGGLPADTTTYTSSGLNSTLTYYFRVRAYNGSGNSGYSNEAIIIICPEAPGSAAASAVSSTQINISWTDNSSNETGFRIERSTNDNTNFTEIATVSSSITTYNSTGLTFNTTYFYRVRAYNDYGNSGYSAETSATTNDIIPYAPSGLSAIGVSSSQINLAWSDNSTNETEFLIERRTASTSFAQIASVSANVTSYSNTGLSPNTTYFYRVRANNGVGSSGYSNTSSDITDDEVPAAPTGLTATAVSSSSIYLSWSDNSSNETSFIIHRSQDSGFSTFTSITVSANTTGYSDTGLSASTLYFYRIYSHNGIGDSGYSNEAQATTNAASSSTQIIADHTIVDRYSNIPQVWIDEVKKMWVNIPGESHSQAYRTGLTLLMQQDSRFAVNVIESGTPEAYTGQHLRSSRAIRNIQYSNWGYGTGESDWYTWYAADPSGTSNVKNHIAYCNNNNYGKIIIGFGWCWDMTWQNNPGGTVDPVYHVRWAGSSEGGPDGSKIWGLDSDDYSLTGNRVSMDTYLNATESYRSFCAANNYSTQVIFTTGPVDGATGENGYQRHVKHEYMRNFVRANADRMLFDYADILCYNDDGSQNPVSWTDTQGTTHTYPIITTTNVGDGSIGHIGSAGALRLAKAQWWMLARLAGWNGVGQ